MKTEATNSGSSAASSKGFSRLRFQTEESKKTFLVEYLGHDGSVTKCPQPVSKNQPCQLNNIKLGEGRMAVSSEDFDRYLKSYRLDKKDVTVSFDLKTKRSLGQIIPWTIGGVAAVTGLIFAVYGRSNEKFSDERIVGAWSLIGSIPFFGAGFFFGKYVEVETDVIGD